mgnify:CR=1 FL=1
MIKTETVTIDNRQFTRTYSDTYQIKKVGTNELYTEAVDIKATAYEETDMPIPQELKTLEERVEAVEKDVDAVVNALAEVILI